MRKFNYVLIEKSSIPETLTEMNNVLNDLAADMRGFQVDFMMPYNEMRQDFANPQGRLVMVLMIVYSYDVEIANVVTIDRYLDETGK